MKRGGQRGRLARFHLLDTEIDRVTLLGSTQPIRFTRSADGLALELPVAGSNDLPYVVKIEPK